MNKIEKILNDIESLQEEEKKKLSVSQMIPIVFNSVSQDITSRYQALASDHSKGEKAPNEMYIDAIKFIESWIKGLPNLQQAVFDWVNVSQNRIQVYDICLSEVKKTNEEQEENLESDLTNLEKDQKNLDPLA